MIYWDSFTYRYGIVVGSTVRYADKMSEAKTILHIMQFGEQLQKILKKF